MGPKASNHREKFCQQIIPLVHFCAAVEGIDQGHKYHTYFGGGVRDFCPAKLETALRKMWYIT